MLHSVQYLGSCTLCSRLPSHVCRLVSQNVEMVGPVALALAVGVYGDVLRLKMLPSRSSAMVQLANSQHAATVIRCLDGARLGGRSLSVSHSTHTSVNDSSAVDFSTSNLGRFDAMSPEECVGWSEASRHQRIPPHTSPIAPSTLLVRCVRIPAPGPNIATNHTKHLSDTARR